MKSNNPAPVKIVVAANAFKGSLDSVEVKGAIEAGIKLALPDAEVVSLLVSDGGDGFVQALAHELGADKHWVDISGPLGETVRACFLFVADKQVAILEMAAASGLALLDPDKLDPMQASTFGLGEMITASLDLGARHIVLGIGGSATSDGGTGMASALGIEFFDADNNLLFGNAENLNKISHLNLSTMDARLKNVTFDVACDVSNPLLGDQGAATVYGPQKGADLAQVLLIEKGLANLANVIERDLGVNVRDIPGGGAAGGVGAALFAFFKAKIKPGAELLLDILDFDNRLQDASLLITTEGRLDFQTGFGKAPGAVAKRAKKQNVPSVIIAGQIVSDNLDSGDFNFDKSYAFCGKNAGNNISVEYAMVNAAALLTEKTADVIRDRVLAGMK